MIEKLHPTGTSSIGCIEKVNELVDVVNALIKGDFPANINGREFLIDLSENLRDAQSKVKIKNGKDEEDLKSNETL